MHPPRLVFIYKRHGLVSSSSSGHINQPALWKHVAGKLFA